MNITGRHKKIGTKPIISVKGRCAQGENPKLFPKPEKTREQQNREPEGQKRYFEDRIRGKAEEIPYETRKRVQDSRSKQKMPVEMVERFPFGETEHAQRKAEREEEKRKKPVHHVRIERAKIQERRKRQHAREREVIFVFGVEVELERGNGEREDEDVRVGSSGKHVEEYPDDREI